MVPVYISHEHTAPPDARARSNMAHNRGCILGALGSIAQELQQAAKYDNADRVEQLTQVRQCLRNALDLLKETA